MIKISRGYDFYALLVYCNCYNNTRNLPCEFSIVVIKKSNVLNSVIYLAHNIMP